MKPKKKTIEIFFYDDNENKINKNDTNKMDKNISNDKKG